MIRLSPWVAVGCLVLLTVGGAGFALAAETRPTAATQQEAGPTQAELEVRKAELRLQYAEMALADVEAQVGAGLATGSDRRAAQREVEEAKLALAAAQLAARREEKRRVSIDVEHASLETVLKRLFEDTPYSYVVNPAVGNIELEPLTIHAKNVDLDAVLQAVCETYDLDLKLEKGQVYYFTPRVDVVTVGGRRVPLIGAVSTGGGERSAWESRVLGSPSGPLATEALPIKKPVEFPGSKALVDLEVKDAPLADVLSQLSDLVNASLAREAERLETEQIAMVRRDMAMEEAPRQGHGGGNAPRPTIHRASSDLVVYKSQVSFIAPDSLRDVRVTARVYRWPAGEVLQMLIDQADLVCTQEGEQTALPPSTAPSVEGGEPIEIQHNLQITRIYLVPRPRLSVVGAGIDRGGHGSGGAGTGLSGVGGFGGGGG